LNRYVLNCQFWHFLCVISIVSWSDRFGDEHFQGDQHWIHITWLYQCTTNRRNILRSCQLFSNG